ncbi:hypothetical protein B0H14DRAFT_2766005 [Mycena olivaceomarginata]|nr:hypothetical protein B0H14DRAFT_2766005 [Mycena olivaceomarginata]
MFQPRFLACYLICCRCTNIQWNCFLGAADAGLSGPAPAPLRRVPGNTDGGSQNHRSWLCERILFCTVDIR